MPAAALFAFPFFGLIVFAALGPVRGLIWTTVTGYLFLPEDYGFSITGLPDYDKNMAITLSLLAGVAVFRSLHRDEVPGTELDDRLFRNLLLGCFALLLLAQIVTVQGNQSALVDADRVRQGLGWRDLLSMTSQMVFALLPFFLARRWLNSPEHHRQLLLAVVAMGLAYTLLVLFELRMSPQLNKWIYGYFPHSWRQHLRGGGYRPLVFLHHGLWLGFFLFMVTLSAFALARQSTANRRLMFLAAGGWSLLVLLLSRNLGASGLALLFVPAVLFLGTGLQGRVAALVAVVFLSYPMLRQADLVPVDSFVAKVESFAPDRARSLRWRTDNEEEMLARSLEKPVFGWGGWGRWRVIDEKGRDTTTADGLWIITLGERGWSGYIGFFGFLTLPLLFLPRARRRKGLPLATAGMGMIMAGNLVYLIPNSALNPIGWLMAGALAGYVQFRGQDRAAPGAVRDRQDDARAAPRYTRFGADARDTAAALRR